MGNVFGPVRFLLPVCRLSWFLYTLNIYAHEGIVKDGGQRGGLRVGNEQMVKGG